MTEKNIRTVERLIKKLQKFPKLSNVYIEGFFEGPSPHFIIQDLESSTEGVNMDAVCIIRISSNGKVKENEE